MKNGTYLAVLTLVLGGITLPHPPLGAQEFALIRELSGTVELKAAGSEIWTAAAAGDRVEKNTIISTGFRSTATLAVGDSLIMVRPVTRLSLEELIRNQDSEEIDLYLHTGRVRAEVKPVPGGSARFTVRSPVATASVRGTSFEFDTERLVVDEGQVQYSANSGREVYVAAGGMSYVDEINSTVISPFDAAAELLAPALPQGSASGAPLGDHAPTPPLGAAVGLDLEWD
jgi:ferric-dicitrate binding protein FerR (iron transport regulator)